MVVVAILSVDLVESVDLVSVILVVNCTWLYLFRQTVDGFVPMFTPKLGADKEFRPIQMTQQQLASIRNTVPLSVPEATPSSVAIQNPGMVTNSFFSVSFL